VGIVANTRQLVIGILRLVVIALIFFLSGKIKPCGRMIWLRDIG
jgi:hypothetical protein